MAHKLGTGARNAMVDALAALHDGGTIKIYTGSQPTNPQTAIGAQVLLGTLTFGDPAFGAASSGVATANAITQDSAADATGTAAWFRVLAEDGTTVIRDGTIGTSGADLNLNTTSIVEGGPIAVTSMTLTMPE